MVGLRKGHSYSTKVKRAYTRKSKYKKLSYIRGSVQNKVIKFDQGDLKKEFKTHVHLVAKDQMTLRHNAIESARIVVNRRLSKTLGTNYHLKIRAHPHHILRENKMLTGAGADRMQSGMQRAFGKPIGLAAQVKKGKKIISVGVDAADKELVIKAFKSAMQRLPKTYRIEFS